MNKYHVALSFAGEDREYVEAVAVQLRSEGVDVFYDRFEEEDLWGKDLYEHLTDVYQNQALFTVMFISDAYTKKRWGNHERKAAQARAIGESQEYILPAFFDEPIEVPGLLSTTGYVVLEGRSPEQLARLIVKKLKKAGVQLKHLFSYSENAKADIDFPLRTRNRISGIIRELKSYNWYTQNPAVERLLRLNWDKVTSDQSFVLGRNLYQCACGNERRAVQVLQDLRRELAVIPEERVFDVVNGMFFEAYFDSKGEFRGNKLKGRYLRELLQLQTVKKFESSIMFIRRAVEPYRQELPLVPSTSPETVSLELRVKRGDPPTVRSLTSDRRELLEDDEDRTGRAWRLSFQSFTADELAERLSDDWSIPMEQLSLSVRPRTIRRTKLRLPEGKSIRWPEGHRE